MRIGIDTPSPTAIASPLRKADKKFIRPWEASLGERIVQAPEPGITLACACFGFG